MEDRYSKIFPRSVKKIRIIPRLDIKNDYVIKGISFDGLRKVGDPVDMALEYYEQGADELIIVDAVASYYDKTLSQKLVENLTKNVMIPVTVGGGIRTVSDIQSFLNVGADRVAVNTAIVQNEEFIKEAINVFGAQCIVGSINAKKVSSNKWLVYINNGRDETELDVIEWALNLQNIGVSEIMITSIDQDGTNKGCDFDLIESLLKVIKIPVMICGGIRGYEDIKSILEKTDKETSFCIASSLHYKRTTIKEIKDQLSLNNFKVRVNENCHS